MRSKVFINILLLICSISIVPLGAQNRGERERPEPTLGLENGTTVFKTSSMVLELVNESQTVSALRDNGSDDFDYTMGDRLEFRSGDGFYHLGDLNLQLRIGSSEWKEYSTAKQRKGVEMLSDIEENIFAAANLKNTLPEDFPLELIRRWEDKDGHIVLRFELINNGNSSVELGALGIPLIFNNNHGRKSLDEAHTENVFFDPYIGLDAGYLQVIRLNGLGSPLLVLPWKDSPFEAYRPLNDDPTRRGITFEGFHEWMIHSKAYAETEWKEAEPWNIPTSKIIAPGESYEVGLEFVLAPSVREIESTISKYQRPLAQGVPGFVLPMDVNGKLFLKYGSDVKSIEAQPAGNVSARFIRQTANGWKEYQIEGKKWGRVRLLVRYEDGTQQTIHYKVIKKESEVVADNGRFLTEEQWLEEDDLFGRSPSPITYDYEEKIKVVDDTRSWIAGLSDEGGAGAWLNAMMKQLVQPDPEEVAKMERFVHETMWGGIQYDNGPRKYGVRKSMYYYEPDSVPDGTYSPDKDYSTWASWSKKAAESTVRSYNYPHVAAAHWVMYRLSRFYKGLVKNDDWTWYLDNAHHTALAMVDQAPHYAEFGQMEGSVFLFILEDLRREGMVAQANALEAAMKKRAEHWASLNYPFGSEMPWDSTGQEEVYMWSRYFGFSEKAMVTLNAIMAYMPTVPNWAYNGNARRYWDFVFGGKLRRIERQIHHYGSPLNAIPILYEYRMNPEDFYLLRVGYGGTMGALANITQDGFAPCAFHSYPSTLENDGISGDYGSGYYGYAVNSATYIYNHDDFGWLAFGGNVGTSGEWIRTELTTASKAKVFIAEANIWITADAGTINKVEFNPETEQIRLSLDKATDYEPVAYLNVSSGVDKDLSNYSVKKYKRDSRGAYKVKLKSKPIVVILDKK